MSEENKSAAPGLEEFEISHGFFAGLKVVIDPSLPPDTIQIRGVTITRAMIEADRPRSLPQVTELVHSTAYPGLLMDETGRYYKTVSKLADRLYP